ncbi:hypothetical protein M0638_11165 [Roseomonas sp. NAR14]|uniref:Uncharacterized protein n=1 Tax=Roseomonas acroporae TaxID=2937791 RepID=A0A9X1Y7J4_9PROT|nr:hypothetical protein [Roseomonas acroporae]MCK8784941.1 hypothetical protein [Roseomonas acroporae]
MRLLDAIGVLTGRLRTIPAAAGQPAATTEAAPSAAPLAAAARQPAAIPPGPRGTVGRESRAWRNRNPGNLRPPSSWAPDGLVATDTAPLGPFCVFGTEMHGWQAMATRILQLAKQGRRTVPAIIGVWAPPGVDGNDTGAYVAGVCAKLGISRDEAIDPRRLAVMTALGNAIRRHEGKPTDPAWDMAAQREGFLRAGVAP